METVALIPASGVGSRMGSATPKQFMRTRGDDFVLFTTLRSICRCPLISSVIVVVHPEHIDAFPKEIAKLRDYDSRVSVNPCGKSTRHRSIRAGLALIHPEAVVVIHDSVRCFVDQKTLAEVIRAAWSCGGASSVRELVSTVIQENQHGNFTGMLDRSKYLSSETPQAFLAKHLASGYEDLSEHELDVHTECVDVANRGGAQVRLIRVDARHFKITTPPDLVLAKYMFHDKIVVVTGAGRGIGRHIATRLAVHGFHVVGVSRTETELQELCKTTKGSYVAMDINGPKDRLESHLRELSIPVYSLVNCAGSLSVGDATEDSLRKMMDVNFFAAASLTMMEFVEPGGVVVNVGSSSVDGGRPGQAAYSASKAALTTFTQSYAKDKRDISFYMVIPRRTDTSMRTEFFESSADCLHPDEVAEVVAGTIVTSCPQTSGGRIYVK